MLHPLQRFTAGDIKRTLINAAPYNPRTITTKARAKLQTALQKLGLLEPLVWNKRTGNLVGGHQRLKLLDGLADGAADYLLTLAIVDLSEAEEIEANILLNNPEAQGRYELPKLGELLKTPGVMVEGTGYDLQDVHRIFGDAPAAALAKSASGTQTLTEQLREYSKHFEGTKQKEQALNHDPAAQDDFYLVLVFRTDDDATAFLKRFELDENERYVNAATLLAKIDGDDEPAKDT